MRRALFGLLGASLLVVGNADGQKNCRKGIPCGNTCIAANKVCHVGTPANPPAAPPPCAPTYCARSLSAIR